MRVLEGCSTYTQDTQLRTIKLKFTCAVNMYTDSYTRMERAIRVKFTLAN